MKPIIYRFSINGHRVNPIYKDDLSVEHNLESSQQFFRAKLPSKLSFIRDDYDWLDAQDFETDFILTIEESTDGGKSFGTYFTGKFMKTDCTWDKDNKKCEADIDTYDDYTDVIAGLDKEYNLIELTPEIEKITIQRRPLIQVYIPGDDVVTCFIAGTYWEQETTEAVDDTRKLINTYHFAKASELVEIYIGSSGYSLLNGLYCGKAKNGTFQGRGDAYKIEYYNKDKNIGSGLNPTHRKFSGLNIVDNALNVVVYNYEIYEDFRTPYSGEKYPYIETGTITFKRVSEHIAPGDITADLKHYDIYMRWLIDREYIGGTSGLQTYNIPQEDIMDDNRNYRYCIGYNFDLGTISYNYSDTPTKYGRTNDGKYFAPPASIFGEKFYPVAKSQWNWASVWFEFSTIDEITEEQGRMPFTLRNAYPLSSVISVLLKQFSEVTHEATPEYSQFLYNETNPISGQAFELLITQKSNVLHGDYDQPAQKAPVTLNTILNTLKNVFCCYWYIEGKKLKIEHIQFLKNGGTYAANPQISVDLTKLLVPNNKKPWAYLTSNYEYDKADMPERYQFEWMDDVSEAFTGYPIEIRSKYVSEGNIEDVTVSDMTTDIDYMMMNPNAISQDGFALFAATFTNLWGSGRPSFLVFDGYIGADGEVVYNKNGNGKGWRHTFFDNVTPGVSYQILDASKQQVDNVKWAFYDIAGKFISQAATTAGQQTTPGNCYRLALSWRAETGAQPTGLPVVNAANINYFVAGQRDLPFIRQAVDGANLRMQNGLLSWITLHPIYFVYDLPAKKVTINRQEMELTHISRKKKQKVSFPTLQDIDTTKLIKTYIGDGQIEKKSVNLSSRMNEITLIYDTE